MPRHCEKHKLTDAGSSMKPSRLLKINEKEKILKVAREKQQILYREEMIQMIADLLGTIEARDSKIISLKCWKNSTFSANFFFQKLKQNTDILRKMKTWRILARHSVSSFGWTYRAPNENLDL